ncbi:MAG TPA: hypothetical protein VHT96_16660 [Clostridia bacterium]|nr:hypothetical protein [Clostridia bacterium]
MEYNAILKQVEEQKKEKSIAGKMFRYSGLILAVDFFSQKLNSQQIMESAFDFVNELLTLERSAMYCKKSGRYELEREKGRPSGIKNIEGNEALDTLAVFHGSIIVGTENILRYFSSELVESYRPEIVLPVFSDKELEGFILIPQKETGPFDDNDYIICEVLMKLFNSSLMNYRAFNELQSTNVSLDEKIFNLFAINQSSKVLLSELNLDVLYRLSTDIFSELTQSSATGFILYDEKSERYVLRSSRFIFDSLKAVDVELEMKKPVVIEPNRTIIDMSDEGDRNYFNSIFIDGVRMLNELEARYLVLLEKEGSILGLVTLGVTVTGSDYKQSIFELIESLASSTYISISNAKHFKLVNEHKALLQEKLDRLISLNNLTKNINSSNNIDTLAEVTINTLRISFNAHKCLIALYDKVKNNFRITKSFGINPKSNILRPGTAWSRVMKGRTASAFKEEELRSYFGENMAEIFEDVSSALIVPVYLDKSEIDILGAIIVFEFSGSIISDEENVLTMETVAGHIAPIIYNLGIIEEQNRLLIPNYPEIFRNDLKKEIGQAELFDLGLCVLKVFNTEEFQFSSLTVSDDGRNMPEAAPDMAEALKIYFPKIYPVSHNTVYIISNEKPVELMDKIAGIPALRSVSVKLKTFGEDFSSYEDFFC